MEKVTEEFYGKMIGPEALQFQRHIQGPIEKVWAYLTEGEKRGQWLASGAMDLKTGGKVELIFDHEQLTPHKEEIPEKYQDFDKITKMYGEVTELNPPTLLSYTWGEENGISEVTFELRPENKKVHLTLVHRKLGNDRDMLTGILAGWHTHLGILSDKLEDKTPKPFWKTHMGLETEYAQRLT